MGQNRKSRQNLDPKADCKGVWGADINERPMKRQKRQPSGKQRQDHGWHNPFGAAKHCALDVLHCLRAQGGFHAGQNQHLKEDAANENDRAQKVLGQDYWKEHFVACVFGGCFHSARSPVLAPVQVEYRLSLTRHDQRRRCARREILHIKPLAPDSAGAMMAR